MLGVVRQDGGFLPWMEGGENLGSPPHPWRMEEGGEVATIFSSYARGGDALPPSREEEGSFLELRRWLNFPRTVLKRIGKVENLYK